MTLWYDHYFLLLTVLHCNGQVEQKLTTDNLDPQVIETYMTQLFIKKNHMCQMMLSFGYCIAVISTKQGLLKEI